MKRWVLLLIIGVCAQVSTFGDDYLWQVNSARWAEGSGSVILTQELHDLAAYNNLQMIRHNMSGHWGGWAHRRQWMDDRGVSFTYFGEVACWFFDQPVTAAYALEVFRTSPVHWNALMDPRYNEMSYAVTRIAGETAVTIILLED